PAKTRVRFGLLNCRDAGAVRLETYAPWPNG
ncbi:MAG: hypothetical protein AVDCRST_MAG54-662, partial [uncultured Actinomycetospora sp.]